MGFGNISQKVIAYVGDNKDVLRKINQIQQANRSMAVGLGKDFGQVTKIMGDRIQTFSQKTIIGKGQVQEVNKFSQAVQLSNGKMGTLITSTTKLNGKVQSSASTFREADKNTVSFGQNIARLAKRALLTIPIWFALRTAIQGTFKVIRDGLKTIAEQDRMFQKALVNISATAKSQEELNSQFEQLQKRTLELSLQTGKSVTDITSAFQRFATVGFGFEVAMTGATEATKLAVARFGETEENANALARAFRLLSDNSKDTISTSEQLSKTVALIAELWKDQAFEVDELAGALERFAPVANIANFSMEETIKILSALQTAGIRGTRAGRLLSTATLQLNKNFDKLNSILGLNVNPEMLTTFELLQVVLKEINKLQNISPFKATKALNELFQVRSTQVVAGLASSLDNMNKVLGQTGNIKKWNDEFEKMTEQTHVLTERVQKANKQIGKAFIEGLISADEYNKLLKKIVNNQKKVAGSAEIIGETTKRAFISVGAYAVLAFNKQILKTIALIGTKLIPLLRSPALQGAGAIFGILTIKDNVTRFRKDAEQATSDLNKIGEDLASSITKGMENKLNEADLTNIILAVETFGPKFFNLGEKGYSALLTILKKNLEVQKQITDEQKDQLQTETDKAIDNKATLKNALEQLKILGFQNSEILKSQGLYQNRLNIQETFEDKLDRQLEIEREINDEKRLQSRLSSDALKLFDIAQSQGADIAKEIGDVLSGKIDFSTFVRRGGDAVETFKKDFADVFKEQQALAFFQGNTVPGLKGLRGGTGIELGAGDLSAVGRTSASEVLRSAEMQTSLARRRLEYEEKITALREAELSSTLELINIARNRQSTNMLPKNMVSNAYDRNMSISHAKIADKASQIYFQSGSIQLSISGDVPKDLTGRTNLLIEHLEKEIKNKLVGKQSSTL